jgi:hypothetical protein
MNLLRRAAWEFGWLEKWWWISLGVFQSLISAYALISSDYMPNAMHRAAAWRIPLAASITLDWMAYLICFAMGLACLVGGLRMLERHRRDRRDKLICRRVFDLHGWQRPTRNKSGCTSSR